MNSTKKSAGKLFSLVVTVALICLMAAAITPGVMGADPADLGGASSFAVLGGTTVTNAAASQITGDLGVSPGTAITGFQQPPANTISGPGTVTGGQGLVSGTIFAGGPVAAQAHNDATIAYNYLMDQTPDTTYLGVTQLDGMRFTPGVYLFDTSANLQVNGNVYLDFQGDPDAVFIFQTGTTLVTMAGSKVIVENNPNSDTCSGTNVYWAVGSSATIDGAEFVGTVISYTTITMTSAGNIPPVTTVSGRMLALGGEVTMVDSMIAICGGTVPPANHPPVLKPIKNKKVCEKEMLTFMVSASDPDQDKLTYSISVLPDGAVFDPVTQRFTWTPAVGQAGTYPVTFTVTDSRGLSDSETVTITVSNDGTCRPPRPCSDFITGGGWINDKATFGVSGGIKNDKPWGQLSFNDHNGVKVKSTKVTAYTVIDPVTRKIEGIARVNGKGSYTYTVIVADNGEPGRTRDTFSLVLSNGYSYSTSGILKGGNIQLHKECGKPQDKDDKEKYDDKDERDGHNNCDNDRLNHWDLFEKFKNNNNKK